MGKDYVVKTFTRVVLVFLVPWSAPFGEKRSFSVSKFCPCRNVNICSCGCFRGPCGIIDNYKGTKTNLIRVILKQKKKYHEYLIRLRFSGRLKFVTSPKKCASLGELKNKRPKKSLKWP